MQSQLLRICCPIQALSLAQTVLPAAVNDCTCGIVLCVMCISLADEAPATPSPCVQYAHLQVSQASQAVEAAWRAGVARQRLELLLPLIGATGQAAAASVDLYVRP